MRTRSPSYTSRRTCLLRWMTDARPIQSVPAPSLPPFREQLEEANGFQVAAATASARMEAALEPIRPPAVTKPKARDPMKAWVRGGAGSVTSYSLIREAPTTWTECEEASGSLQCRASRGCRDFRQAARKGSLFSRGLNPEAEWVNAWLRVMAPITLSA